MSWKELEATLGSPILLPTEAWGSKVTERRRGEAECVEEEVEWNDDEEGYMTSEEKERERRNVGVVLLSFGGTGIDTSVAWRGWQTA
jgi:hypothetical protein